MAKKKVVEEEDLDDEDDDFEDFEDEEFESHYPEVKPKEESVEDPRTTDEEDLDEEDFEFEIEPSEPEQTYKYLQLTLHKTAGENDYSLKVEGQSHGFLNIFVKHLLTTEGVNSAAYRVTQIELPEIFIRLEEGYELKDVLYKGIDALRNEVSEAQTLFKKLM